MLAAAGLLTIAQGAFAFFSTQNYVKQADDAVDKIKNLAGEVRAKYPMFSQLEETLDAAFRRLGELAVRLDLDQNLYADSDPRTRQEILALEGLAAMQFVVTSVRVPHIVTQIRLPGKFYADKYVSAGKTIDADFDKALYYFSPELEKSGRDILSLNDLGWLHMEVAGDKARLGQARAYLEKAAGVRNWEKTPNEPFASNVHYNLACTYSCLAAIGRRERLEARRSGQPHLKRGTCRQTPRSRSKIPPRVGSPRAGLRTGCGAQYPGLFSIIIAIPVWRRAGEPVKAAPGPPTHTAAQSLGPPGWRAARARSWPPAPPAPGTGSRRRT